MGKIVLYWHKNKWFSLIEAVMSVVLIMIFLFWVYKFFNVQNKSINSLMVENNAANLVEDASLFIADINYNELNEWSYWFYYNETNFYDADYRLIPINSLDDTTYEDGKYLDEKGHLVDYNPNYPEWVYKMLIKVYPETQAFDWQNFKNVSIYMWYNWCEFNWPPCITKDFVKVWWDTDNLIWKNWLKSDIDTMPLSK